MDSFVEYRFAKWAGKVDEHNSQSPAYKDYKEDKRKREQAERNLEAQREAIDIERSHNKPQTETERLMKLRLSKGSNQNERYDEKLRVRKLQRERTLTRENQRQRVRERV